MPGREIARILFERRVNDFSIVPTTSKIMILNVERMPQTSSRLNILASLATSREVSEQALVGGTPSKCQKK
jgi:hypothetical protein